MLLRRLNVSGNTGMVPYSPINGRLQIKMKKNVINIFFCILCAVNINSAFAQNKQTEKRLSDTAGGYDFAVPAGFSAKQTEEGFGLVNTAQTVVIAVKSHEFKSFEEFFAQSNLKNDGFSLVGKVQDVGETGKTFLAAKQTAQDVLLVNTLILFSPYGGGALIVSFSDQDNNQKGFQTVLQIAEGMTFAKSAKSASANAWQTFLSGKQLIYLYTSSGFSERTDIYLCASGGFFYRRDSSSLSSNGSGVIGASSDGNWKISSNNGGNLLLQFRSGTVREYKISRRQAGNEIGLNGNRYFVKTQNECR